MGAKGGKQTYASPYGAYGPAYGPAGPYAYPPQAYNKSGKPQKVRQAPYAVAPPVGAYGPAYTRPYAAPYAAPAYAHTYAAPARYAPTYAAPVAVAAPRMIAAPVAHVAPHPVVHAAPAYAPTYMHSAPAVLPATTYAYGSNALALDAADGVIDGRYFGAPVVGAGYGAAIAPRVAYSPTYSTAQPITRHATTYSYGSGLAGAAALDAADGVMDGRYFGAPVVGAGLGAYGVSSYAPAYAAAPAYGHSGYYGLNAAHALDAADGVLDGRYFGAPVVGAGLPAYTMPTTSYAAPALSYGTHYGTHALSTHGYSGLGSAALSLDAADGVIDGRYFGAPVVGSGLGAYRSYGTPALSSYAPAAVTSYAPSILPSYAAAPVYGGYGGSALALDAADGVLDGKFFGAGIVGAGAPAYSGYAASPVTAYAPHSFAPATYGYGAPATYGYGHAPSVVRYGQRRSFH